jgi:uncharacterized protein YoxC
VSAYFSIHVEGLSTEEIKNVLEKVSSEWKSISQHLEGLARKIQLQEDINAYFKQLDELEKILKTKEEWVQHTRFSKSSQKSLSHLKDSCQVKSQTPRSRKHSMPVFYIKQCASLFFFF